MRSLLIDELDWRQSSIAAAAAAVVVVAMRRSIPSLPISLLL
jgi:hypothetical protein